MKYIFLIFVFIGCLSLYVNSFAINYKEGVFENENIKTPNSNLNINKAKLLCSHVINFKKNVNKIISKYDLDGDFTLKKTTILISKMESACQVISTKNIEKDDANIIIGAILKDLAILNKGIKKHLKTRIDNIKKQREYYNNIAKKIAYHLDILTQKLDIKIHNSGKTNNRYNQIQYHVYRLKKISHKLKRFHEVELYKISEFHAALVRIITEIRKEVKNIRDL